MRCRSASVILLRRSTRSVEKSTSSTVHVFLIAFRYISKNTGCAIGRSVRFIPGSSSIVGILCSYEGWVRFIGRAGIRLSPAPLPKERGISWFRTARRGGEVLLLAGLAHLRVLQRARHSLGLRVRGRSRRLRHRGR